MAERIFRGFLFLGRWIFWWICRQIFSPHFSPHSCGQKCPEKSSRKIPGKILQILHNQNPRHISAEGPPQKFSQSADDSSRPLRNSRKLSSQHQQRAKLKTTEGTLKKKPSPGNCSGIWVGVKKFDPNVAVPLLGFPNESPEVRPLNHFCKDYDIHT